MLKPFGKARLTRSPPHHDFPNDLHHHPQHQEHRTYTKPTAVTMAGTPTLDEMKQAFLVTLRGLQEKEQQLTEKEEQLVSSSNPIASSLSHVSLSLSLLRRQARRQPC
jgi:hypothetical protein